MRKGTKRKASRKDGAAAQSKKEEEEEVQNEPSQAVEENHKVPTESQLAASEEDGKIAEPADKSAAAAAAEAAVEESTKDEPSGKQEKEEVKKKQEPKRRAKRARIEKPQEEPEYFEEKRNVEDLWLQLVPVGTEWEQVDLVYRYKWSFRNLEDAFEEGGELYGKKVYLFECTEPQYISVQGDHKVVVIPVVVAVVSPFPPSDKIGIASVQRESEEIVPMKQMKMDWVPYIPLENRGSQVERLKSTQIFILGCTQRRAGLKHMNEERVKKFQYCLPYFYQPFKEDEDEDKTDVPIMFPTEPPVVCEFDWEFDILEEYTDNLIKEDQLPADQKDAFKDFVKEKVREAKKAKREVKEARKKALEEMSAETKAAYQNIKFFKFYPVSTPDTPDVSSVKSPFINRYYGKAHKVL